MGLEQHLPDSLSQANGGRGLSSPRTTRFVDYWEKSVPWTFKGEPLSYEEKRRLRYSLQDYMLEAIPFSKFKSRLVLEIGSGGGIDSAEFGRNGAAIVSLDFTKTGVETTQNTLSEAGVIPSVIRASGRELPFKDNSFDCVYSFGVLHHIPEVDYVVDEICRVMKKGGEILCMLYNKRSLLYAYSILFLHQNEGLPESELVRRYSERILNSPYTKVYTKESACELFAKQFDVQARVFYNVIDTPKERKVKIGISDENELGWHIIVRGRRRDKASPDTEQIWPVKNR